MRSKKYRVVLEYPFGITHSIFIKDKNRIRAEQHALRKHRKANRVAHSSFPLN